MDRSVAVRSRQERARYNLSAGGAVHAPSAFFAVLRVILKILLTRNARGAKMTADTAGILVVCFLTLG